MTPDILHRAGEALYGARWQSELSRALGVSDRTVRRWMSGDAIPIGVAHDLLAVCDARAAELATVIVELRAVG